MTTPSPSPETLGSAWLGQLLQFQGLAVPVRAESISDEGGESCWLTLGAETLAPEQVQTLQGDKGQVLDALQYLANTILNLGRSREQQQAYTVELAGYRQQRQQELKEMALAAIAHLRETGQPYDLGALSSAERRHLHQFCSQYEGVTTISQGKEPDRHLVVQWAEDTPTP